MLLMLTAAAVNLQQLITYTPPEKKIRNLDPGNEAALPSQDHSLIVCLAYYSYIEKKKIARANRAQRASFPFFYALWGIIMSCVITSW